MPLSQSRFFSRCLHEEVQQPHRERYISSLLLLLLLKSQRMFGIPTHKLNGDVTIHLAYFMSKQFFSLPIACLASGAEKYYGGGENVLLLFLANSSSFGNEQKIFQRHSLKLRKQPMMITFQRNKLTQPFFSIRVKIRLFLEKCAFLIWFLNMAIIKSRGKTLKNGIY